MELTTKNITMPILRRLPKYRRILIDLINECRNKISSKELAQLTGLTSSQIRYDFNVLGASGYQGYGYKVEELLKVIEEVLGSNLNHSCIVVGMDNRGITLAQDKQLSKNGFIVKALFDNYPRRLEGLPKVRNIKDLENYLRENSIDIAILTAEDKQASELANLLAQSGVKAILNFTNRDLDVPDGVFVENASAMDKLYFLASLLTEKT